MQNTSKSKVLIVEPAYFSNWADIFMPKIANRLLPLVSLFPWITPNVVTIFSFVLYTLGAVSLFIPFSNHLIFTAILLPLAYILDCLDGQLARIKAQFSTLGDYLDKTLDVLKIYVVTISLALAAFLRTNDVLYIFLGFTACFFFNFRYYIKLETIFSVLNRDKEFLEKSRAQRYELYDKKRTLYASLWKTFFGKLKVLWYWNRSIFAVDEAEFVVFTALGALLNRLELVLWILVISQVVIAFFRLYERGKQVHTNSPRLYWPMRK